MKGLQFALIGMLVCTSVSADELEIPGLEPGWRPYRRTLEQKYSRFKQELALARKAGGIDFVHVVPEGIDVSSFVGNRHVLQIALEEVANDPADRHDPTLIAEMRQAVESSEEEIPTPDSVVFVNDPNIRRNAPPSRADAAWKVRKSAEESLAIVLVPAILRSAGEAATHWRIILRIMNSASGTFYMDRRAIASGLGLRLLNSEGADVPLNKRARAMKEYKAIDFNLRAAPITPKYSPAFELDLANYFELTPGENYTLHAEWTLEVHDTVRMGESLDARWKHRITLKAAPVALKFPSSN